MRYFAESLIASLAVNVCERCEKQGQVLRSGEIELCIECFDKGGHPRRQSDTEESIVRFGHSQEHLRRSAQWLPDLLRGAAGHSLAGVVARRRPGAEPTLHPQGPPRGAQPTPVSLRRVM